MSLLGYHVPAVVPPRWPDEQGRPIPTYPCPLWSRSGQPIQGVPRREFQPRGVALFRPASYVNWCGHAQEIIPLPLPDGRVTFVPVLGEAY